MKQGTLVEEKEGQYAKPLAKTQVTAIYLNYARYEENVLPKFQKFVWRRPAGVHPDGHQHGGRKLIETSVTEFCYKRVNLSLEVTQEH